MAVAPTIQSFVPALVVRRFSADPTPLRGPISEEFDAGALFLDISGFTSLAEELAARGADGVEELQKRLNDSFDKLIDEVQNTGGEVVSFAGDAFAAVWLRGRAHKEHSCLAALATQCALAMQEQGRRARARGYSQLDYKIGIGLGRVGLLHVGGEQGRYTTLVRGTALNGAIAAEELAKPGQTIVHTDAWEVIGGDFEMSRRHESGAAMVVGVSREVTPKAPIPPRDVDPRALKRALWGYLPQVLQLRFDSGQARWLGDTRKVTVLFGALRLCGSTSDLGEVNALVATLQRQVFGFEGTINKLSVDEKGISLLAIQGLPPLTHDRDGERGLRAAIGIWRATIEVGLSRVLRRCLPDDLGARLAAVLDAALPREAHHGLREVLKKGLGEALVGRLDAAWSVLVGACVQSIAYSSEATLKLKVDLPEMIEQRLQTGELRSALVLAIDDESQKVTIEPVARGPVLEHVHAVLSESLWPEIVSELEGLLPLAVVEALEDSRLYCSIGVATGVAFCGAIGSDIRREYTVIGDVVNLAARLMQAAKGRVLCDQQSTREETDRLAFEALEPISVKGKSEPVAIFCPREEAETHSIAERGVRLLGRAAEEQQITDAVDKLAERIHAKSVSFSGELVVMIEGKPGMGKSTLADTALEAARSHDIPFAVAHTSEAEATTPYLPWRTIMRRLFGGGGGNLERSVRETLSGQTESLQLMPVLNEIVGNGFIENSITSAMPSMTRHEYARDIARAMISRRAAEAGLVIVIHDLHWLDPYSFELARSLSTEVARLLVVVTTRPPGRRPSAPYLHYRNEAQWHIILDSLAVDDTSRLAAGIWGAKTVDEPVERLVFERSQGNPFFVAQIAHALKDSGNIEIVDGNCRFTDGLTDVNEIGLPSTIQDLLTSRIDRLPSAEQLALKVASCIGDSFTLKQVQAVFPVADAREQLRHHLEMLVGRELLTRSGADEECGYSFDQRSTREAASSLLLGEQRREIHATIARWYEQGADEGGDADFSLLVHHWHEAGETGSALEYVERAAAAANESGSFAEVAQLFENAERLRASLPAEQQARAVTRYRRARWQRHLADAYYGMSRYARAAKSARAALHLARHGVPNGAIGWSLFSALQLFSSGFVRPFSALFEPSGASRGALIDACLASRRLAECAFRANRHFEMRGASRHAVRLAQRLGDEPKVARVFTGVGEISSALGSVDRATKCFSVAESLAARGGDNTALIELKAVRALAMLRHGRWSEAAAALEDGTRMVIEDGDWHDRNTVLWANYQFSYYRGALLDALDAARKMAGFAARHANDELHARALLAVSRVLLTLGRLGEGQKVTQKAAKLLKEIPDLEARLSCLALLAQGNAQREDDKGMRRSLQLALRAAQYLKKPPPLHFLTIDAYVGLGAATLEILLRPPARISAADTAALTETASLVIRRLVAEAERGFPLLVPQAHRLNARRIMVTGGGRRAESELEKALGAAIDLELPVVAAECMMDLSQLSFASRDDRLDYAQRSYELFEKHECHSQALIAQRVAKTLAAKNPVSSDLK